MKNFILWLALALLIFVMAIEVVSVLDNQQQEQDYCKCLGHQPYINTKWTGDDCLTYALDPLNDFDGQAMVEYLYSAQEYCR